MANSYAQDISGLWKGSIITAGSSLYYELVVTNERDKSNGYALTIYVDKGIENIGIKTAEIKKKGNKVVLEDGELVYNNYTTPPRRMKLFASMTLAIEGDLMQLKGTFNTRSLDMRYSESFSGTIQLEKASNPVQSKLIAKLDELQVLKESSIAQVPEKSKKEETKPKQTIVAKANDKKLNENPIAVAKDKAAIIPVDKDSIEVKSNAIAKSGKENKTDSFTIQKENKTFLPTVTKKPTATKTITPAAADLAKRKMEVINNIFFTSDSLILTLYDNGEIDGDTVSIVLNGKVILPQQALTANAIRYVLKITPEMGDSLNLIMYAENLGKIHPNTGLLILQDGDKKHEVRFSGDLQKSPLLHLRRRL